ncbi:DUF2993 domain-containing protein [Streptomyces sp. NPDC097619]|uniref:LmeA family phospholipid-binding protein n=1 Tax=Streptomyces sp. NPDC097619 TaxID=3157228 RepID=UPI00331FB801
MAPTASGPGKDPGRAPGTESGPTRDGTAAGTAPPRPPAPPLPTEPPTGPPAGTGRRSRPLRKLLVGSFVGLLVLAALLVGADRLALGYAEDRAAERARVGGSRAAETRVEIEGFPFLTQALDRRFDEVTARLDGVETVTSDGRGLRITRIDARLHEVRLDGGRSTATAARADGEVFLSYADLSRAARDGVTVAYGGAPGKVKVTAGLSFLGRTLSRSVVSTVGLADGTSVRVRADRVPGEDIPGLAGLIRAKTDFDRRIDGLPKGITLSRVTTDERGVHAVLTGRDVHLGD